MAQTIYASKAYDRTIEKCTRSRQPEFRCSETPLLFQENNSVPEFAKWKLAQLLCIKSALSYILIYIKVEPIHQIIVNLLKNLISLY